MQLDRLSDQRFRIGVFDGIMEVTLAFPEQLALETTWPEFAAGVAGTLGELSEVLMAWWRKRNVEADWNPAVMRDIEEIL